MFLPGRNTTKDVQMVDTGWRHDGSYVTGAAQSKGPALICLTNEALEVQYGHRGCIRSLG